MKKLIITIFLLSTLSTFALDKRDRVARLLEGGTYTAIRQGIPLSYDGNPNYWALGEARWIADGWVKAPVDNMGIYIPEKYLNPDWTVMTQEEQDAVDAEEERAEYLALLSKGEDTSPLLYDHPDPEDVPQNGLFYRLTIGGINTLWYVRNPDSESTQLSSHDKDGNRILRSINLVSRDETTVYLDMITSATKFKDLQDAKVKVNKPKKPKK